MNKKTRNAKARYMSDETFAKLEKSLHQAIAHARGEKTNVRVTRVPMPTAPSPISKKRIANLRKRFNYSQVLFAKLMNVSPKTIQAWEQGLREPSDAALKLLTIAEKHPEVFLDA